jgi:NAD(P)-dependent dehydrogenase (short-subunit alcohol dehydrogenase family)
MKASGVALVTGASRGIGRAVALELAARGFDVIATMRDPHAGADLPAEAAARGGRLRVAALDVDRPATIAIPDGLRVLVNNAGVECATLPVEAQPADDWRRVFETNVFGLVEVTRRAIPALRAAGGGVVCNVTSASLLAPVPFYAVYRASKAAVAALNESLRAELAPLGVRVLEVLPGPIDTDMLAGSERTPEACALPEYRPVAEALHAGRMALADAVTPPTEAARRIADAILDDDAPLRVACDPLGEAMLAGADAAGAESRMAAFVTGLAGHAKR